MTRSTLDAPEPLNDPELAALIIENAVEYGIFTVEPDGRIASWSPGAARVCGYSASEVLGGHVGMLFTEVDRASGVDALEIEKALSSGRAEDSRWHVRRDGSRFWANGVAMRFERHGRPCVLKILRDETRAKRAEEQRVLLLNELNHRIKNTLTTVQSIVEQTLRSQEASPMLRKTLTDRLLALSEAHNVLVSESWAGADLRTVVDQAVDLHQPDGGGAFSVDGPPVRLSPHQAVSMSLALHELATNALKHGALAAPQGRIQVSWNVGHDGDGRRYLHLLWQERGGPPVLQPTRAGFGTRLIARSFGAESGGKATLKYKPSGVECVIGLPLSSSEEIPILEVGKGAS